MSDQHSGKEQAQNTHLTPEEWKSLTESLVKLTSNLKDLKAK